MRLWHILHSRLRCLLFRVGRESDLNEELQLHLERETERLQASGLSHEQARRQARRLFGGVEGVKEASRDARGMAAWDALVRDTRHGLRRLAHDWRFTAAAVLILGLGIGVTTAMFSLVNAVLFRDQALPNPDRIVNIYQNDRQGRAVATSYPAYLEMAEYQDVFDGVVATSIPDGIRYLDAGAVHSGVVEFTTPSYLDVLGLRPSIGRWFDKSEDTPNAAPVVVLGHQIWTRQFRGDPGVIGRTIRIQGMPMTIVGVGPARHRATVNIGLVTDFWMPFAAIPAIHGVAALSDDDAGAFLVKARLREGRTVAQARAAMETLGRRRAAQHPDTDPGRGITVLASTEVRIHPQADALVTGLATLVLVIVGLVLAIACSNLATLLLVRGAARAKEVAVRLAMGGTRRQIVRHLLAESLLLSLSGGIAGCLLAWWSVQWLRGIELPISIDLSMDVRVLAFATALSLVTGVAFGLAPALKATKVDLLPTLRDEGTPPITHRRLTQLNLKNALIVLQVAISVLLLGGTSIFLQMLSAMRALHVGYAVEGVAMIETDVRYAGYSGTEARNIYDELRRRIAAIPGVDAVALSQGLPMRVTGVPIVVEGVERAGAPTDATLVAGMLAAGPGFFETLRIPLVYGRVFDGRDLADTPRVAVVTETMARQFFGTVNAVGRRFRAANDPTGWTEVIGVVGDTGTGDFGNDVLDPIRQLYYRSHTQSDSLPTTIVARTRRDAANLVAAMQRELRGVDAALPVMAAKTMAQDLEDSRVQPKAIALFLGVLGALGLLLASIGLYAVVAFAVARRSREIGIRMALGARSQQVVWSVARGVTGLVGAGTAVGLILSVFAMLALRAASAPQEIGIGNFALYSPEIDPLALLAIAGVMAAVGAAAAFVPARRAARMNPLVALRRE
jgi:predicted permease